jgi:hypothetical protein
MKKIFLLLLLFTNICLGQTTIFSENMGTGTGTLLITSNTFQNTSPITFSGTADVRSTVVSTGYTGISAGRNIFFTAVGRYFEISGINTTNFNNITLSFGQYKSTSTTASNGTEMRLEYSTDGINYTQLIIPSRVAGASWVLITPIGQIPSTNNLRLRFTNFTLTSPTTQFRIDDVKLTGYICSGISTWDGSWSTPPNGNSVVITSNYDTSINGSFEACSLIVNSGSTLNINSGFVKVQNDITNNGTIDISNSGSLVQISDTGVNTGNDITYNRIVSSLNGYDYIYWSSPVGNEALSSLYNISTTTPPTTSGFQYQWNPTMSNTNSTFGNWENVSSNMTPGRGYIMRASSSFGWTGTLTSQFVGIPNNGVITYTVSGIDSTISNYRFNLIGNPYPSALNVVPFLTLNPNLDGYVALWKHANAPNTIASQPYYQSFQYNYSNDYVIYNKLGVSSGLGTFNGYIASGQGFFVNLLPTATPTNALFSSSITFNNSMRSETFSNSQFFRTSESNNEGRIWLDLLNSNNIPTRLLVGYKEDATVERDRLYDAITTQDFYTTINNDKFIIQGRPDFNENDQVNLGINIPTAGEYKIAIAEVDGILTTQNIYLQDLYSNAIYDIRQSPYIFNSNVGTFNDRFILRYTNSTLGNNDFVINNTIIYNKDNKINIDSDKVIKNVRVYDITGKLLYDNNFNSNNIKFSLECSKQILLVKIKTDDDEVITKKISN